MKKEDRSMDNLIEEYGTSAPISNKVLPEPPHCKGGFYACVSFELLQQLLDLSPQWGIKIEVVLAPKSMTTQEEKEMAYYHAARDRTEASTKTREARVKEETPIEAHGQIEMGHRKRQALTYAQAIEEDRKRFHQVNVYVDQDGVRQ
jgi:hypothetical protein